MISATQEVMGTVVSFLMDPGDLSDQELGDALESARSELRRIDEQFSTYRPESELSLLRRNPSRTPSALLREVMELCATAREMTRGFFDPWSAPGGFDPTGLVKGWAGERALSILHDAGVPSALVNAGGDVCVLGERAYDVGIRHPHDPGSLCAVVSTSECVATSGEYERAGHLYHPFGGPIAAVSATVVGGRLAFADAWATALAVGGSDVLVEIERAVGVEALYVTGDGQFVTTSHMTFANDVT